MTDIRTDLNKLMEMCFFIEDKLPRFDSITQIHSTNEQDIRHDLYRLRIEMNNIQRRCVLFNVEYH